VYLRNVDVLMGYFARRCRDPQTVADLTSETFVRAVESFARFEPLVAVDVPAGTDHVVFRFHGYRDYPELLALSGLTLAMVAVAPVCMRRLRWRRASAGARSGGTARAAAQARAR